MTKARDISKLLSTDNGKIAGENLDVSFENITDTGTEGTRVATGTNAQRGTTQGQLRFNTTTGLAEYYTGNAFKSIDAPPTVSSIDVTEVDSQAGGNQTIVITGSSFSSGATVTFVGASGTDFNASTVTVDSYTQITAVAPKASFLNAQEPYGVKLQTLLVYQVHLLVKLMLILRQVGKQQVVILVLLMKVLQLTLQFQLQMQMATQLHIQKQLQFYLVQDFL